MRDRVVGCAHGAGRESLLTGVCSRTQGIFPGTHMAGRDPPLFQGRVPLGQGLPAGWLGLLRLPAKVASGEARLAGGGSRRTVSSVRQGRRQVGVKPGQKIVYSSAD